MLKTKERPWNFLPPPEKPTIIVVLRRSQRRHAVATLLPSCALSSRKLKSKAAGPADGRELPGQNSSLINYN